MGTSLSDRVNWSNIQYTLPDFLYHYHNELPVLVKVVDGYYGRYANDTLERDEVIKVHGIYRQRRVLATDSADNLISIPVENAEKFQVIGTDHKTFGQPQSLDEIVGTVSFPGTFRYASEDEIECCAERSNTVYKFGAMSLWDRPFCLQFLQGVLIPRDDDDAALSQVVLPAYIKVRVVVGESLQDDTRDEWNAFLRTLYVDDFNIYTIDDAEHFKDIMLYNPETAQQQNNSFEYIPPYAYISVKRTNIWNTGMLVPEQLWTSDKSGSSVMSEGKPLATNSSNQTSVKKVLYISGACETSSSTDDYMSPTSLIPKEKIYTPINYITHRSQKKSRKANEGSKITKDETIGSIDQGHDRTPSPENGYLSMEIKRNIDKEREDDSNSSDDYEKVEPNGSKIIRQHAISNTYVQPGYNTSEDNYEAMQGTVDKKPQVNRYIPDVYLTPGEITDIRGNSTFTPKTVSYDSYTQSNTRFTSPSQSHGNTGGGAVESGSGSFLHQPHDANLKKSKSFLSRFARTSKAVRSKKVETDKTFNFQRYVPKLRNPISRLTKNTDNADGLPSCVSRTENIPPVSRNTQSCLQATNYRPQRKSADDACSAVSKTRITSSEIHRRTISCPDETPIHSRTSSSEDIPRNTSGHRNVQVSRAHSAIDLPNPPQVARSQRYPVSIQSLTQVPDDIENLSAEEVADCLHLLHLDKYIESFLYDQMDGAMLKTLDESTMQEHFNMTSFYAKKLVKFSSGWRPQDAQRSVPGNVFVVYEDA